MKVEVIAVHDLHYSAYKYATKEDAEAVHSSGHLDISHNVPRTEKAIGSKKRTAQKPKRGGRRK